MNKFHYLKIGLGVVLAFVGVKMLLAHTAWKIPTLPSLGVVVLILAVSIVYPQWWKACWRSTSSRCATS